jgi:hypothetical protein
VGSEGELVSRGWTFPVQQSFHKVQQTAVSTAIKKSTWNISPMENPEITGETLFVGD